MPWDESQVDSAATAQTSSASSASARYLSATFSSRSSGSSQHGEAQRIVSSFGGASFHSLHKLPAQLRPGGVEESRRRNISSGRSAKPEQVQRHQGSSSSSGGGGLFAALSYSRDEYKKTQRDAEAERQFKELTELSFSRKPFTYATSRVRLKNEDIFGNEAYTFPVLGPGGSGVDLQHVVRPHLGDSSQLLHGPFFVAARRRAPPPEHPRDELRLWARELLQQVAGDWGHLRFTLRCEGAGEDELVLAFHIPPSTSTTTTTTTTKPAEPASVDKDLCAPSPPSSCPPSSEQLDQHTLSHHHDKDEDEEEDDAHERQTQPQSSASGGNSALVTALARYMNTLALHGLAAHRRLRKRGDRWRVLEQAQAQQAQQAQVLVFSFFTPWYSGASRGVQQQSARQGREQARLASQQQQEQQQRQEVRAAGAGVPQSRRARAGGSRSAGALRPSSPSPSSSAPPPPLARRTLSARGEHPLPTSRCCLPPRHHPSSTPHQPPAAALPATSHHGTARLGTS